MIMASCYHSRTHNEIMHRCRYYRYRMQERQRTSPVLPLSHARAATNITCHDVTLQRNGEGGALSSRRRRWPSPFMPIWQSRGSLLRSYQSPVATTTPCNRGGLSYRRGIIVDRIRNARCHPSDRNTPPPSVPRRGGLTSDGRGRTVDAKHSPSCRGGGRSRSSTVGDGTAITRGRSRRGHPHRGGPGGRKKLPTDTSNDDCSDDDGRK